VQKYGKISLNRNFTLILSLLSKKIFTDGKKEKGTPPVGESNYNRRGC
jgi:hypothetical protein